MKSQRKTKKFVIQYVLLKSRYKHTKHPVRQPSCHLQGHFGSNGVDPQLEFTSVTSTDLPHWAPTQATKALPVWLQIILELQKPVHQVE